MHLSPHTQPWTISCHTQEQAAPTNAILSFYSMKYEKYEAYLLPFSCNCEDENSHLILMKSDSLTFLCLILPLKINIIIQVL